MPRISFAVAVLVLGLALAAPAPDDIDDDEVSRLVYILRADKSLHMQTKRAQALFVQIVSEHQCCWSPPLFISVCSFTTISDDPVAFLPISSSTVHNHSLPNQHSSWSGCCGESHKYQPPLWPWEGPQGVPVHAGGGIVAAAMLPSDRRL